MWYDIAQWIMHGYYTSIINISYITIENQR